MLEGFNWKKNRKQKTETLAAEGQMYYPPVRIDILLKSRVPESQYNQSNNKKIKIQKHKTTTKLSTKFMNNCIQSEQLLTKIYT